MKDFFKFPSSIIKKIHFVGIGGIGMSGIAKLYKSLGYEIQGSDAKHSYTISSLEELGIKVFIGHDAKNLEGVDLVVVSSAIAKDNVEYVGAENLSIPIFKRARMLAELMRFKWGISVAGTHGKTTTTSLVSHILQENNYDPTAVIGGIVNAWGQNSRFGQSNWIVAEADESDGTFVDLPATISIVTNIEAEHMDYYKSYDDIKDYFIRFIHKIPFYGFSVICIDDKGVQDIVPFVKNTQIITYGVSPQADFRIHNMKYDSKGSYFDIEVNYKNTNITYKDISLPMFGHHNVLNTVASMIVALNIGIDIECIKDSLKSFKGVKRRYTNLGSVENITFIDDYAHHPSEIEAVINATGQVLGGQDAMVVVVQPHRYTRLKDQFDNFCKCFNKAHFVIVLDVYNAGEKEIEGFNSMELANGIKNRGHKNVMYLKDSSQIGQTIANLQSNSPNHISMAIFMGAGSITSIASDTFKNFPKKSI